MANLEEIIPEKLDENLYFDDKNKDSNKKPKKKKGKGISKKKEEIDIFDYAKDKGIEINLEYEDIKDIQPKQIKNNQHDNPKNKQKKDYAQYHNTREYKGKFLGEQSRVNNDTQNYNKKNNFYNQRKKQPFNKFDNFNPYNNNGLYANTNFNYGNYNGPTGPMINKGN